MTGKFNGQFMVPFSRYISIRLHSSYRNGGDVLFAPRPYPLAKYTSGSKAIFNIVVLSLIFSPHVTAIPNYMIMSGGMDR